MAPLSSNLPEAFPHISGYTLSEKLYEGARTAVYRAVSAAQKPVVIKVMRQSHPDFSELVHFRNQYAITQNLPIPGVVRPLSLEPWQNGYALVMEDFAGCSLQQYTKDQTLSLIEILGIALQMADILNGLNQHHVVHKDIKPANILIQPASKRIQLIDFSIATLLPKETQEIKNPNVLEGTLAYLAPEQTGRMNRGIDYRTDFYGLGVTLYKLLTGQVPFSATDPLELVHCHIAKTPIPAHKVNAAIPTMVSQIVLKLMAKNVEDRYKSALGLKHDLAHCLQLFKDTEEITEFELGQRDVSDRFLIPDKLYGRETEVRQLLAAFERASQGQAEMMLVAGFSGIGKTAVVNEVHKPITRQHGYFIKGKFDQFNRNIPFSAFVQAFRSLMGQLLSESDQQLAQWKMQILAAVGDQGQVIIDVIPELEHIIGPQPAVAELSGNAAQNRFNLLLDKFVQVFTSKDHPLVIFLDDLQWADSASLNLLKLLMNQPESCYLLALGAYRDNEVFPAHPLMLTLDEMRAQGTTLNSLTLAPLGETDLRQLVADTLMCQADMAAPLAQLIAQKTQGNPFFTTQFLTGLYEDSYITFDAELGYWQCDLSQVRQLALTDDVVAFMVGRLQKLPETTQTVLKLAACIGNQFDLATLSIVCNLEQEAIAAHLWSGLQEGLVTPENESYKFFHGGRTQSHSQINIDASITVKYRFLHDRVQQAAYALIPSEEKLSTHFKIGQLLFQSFSKLEQTENVFEVVQQLNKGRNLVDADPSKEELVQLNLIAARKALTSTAYVAATEYLKVAMSLLATDCWESQYETAVNVYAMAAEAAYLSGQFEEVDNIVNIFSHYSRSTLDSIMAHRAKVFTLVSQNNFAEAIEYGLSVLASLDVHLPSNPTGEDVGHALSNAGEKTTAYGIPNLVNLPRMTDPAKVAAMEILASLIGASYKVNPNLFVLIALKKVCLSLEYGNDINSSFGYACYSIILSGVIEDIENAYEMAELSISIPSQIDPKASKASALFVANSYVFHWKQHLSETLKPLQQAYTEGLDAGDFEYASYGAMFYAWYAYFTGKNLADLSQEMSSYSQAFLQIKQTPALNFNQVFHQSVLNLVAGDSPGAYLKGEVCQEGQMLAIAEESSNAELIFYIYFNKLILSYLLQEDCAEAVKNAAAAKQHLSSIPGSLFVRIFNFYSSLTYLRAYCNSVDSEKLALLEKVEENQRKMKTWVAYAPVNCLHQFRLVEAEKLRVLNQTESAIELYDQAIEGAKENGYCQEEALANELAAKLYLSVGEETRAENHLQAAYYGYARWGAKAKTDALEQRYPTLLEPILQQQAAQSLQPLNPLETIVASQLSIHSSTHASAKISRTSTTNINASLDFAAVLKASQALSGTIELEDLLHQLTQIILQNSGGDRCALILTDTDGSWQLKALATPDNTALLSEPLAGHPKLPLKLIQYVKNTQKTVVINKLETDLPVIDDFLEKSKPQSLLCLPLLNQSKLLGILYLRNRNTCGAFTQERIHILGFLCTQAAISLENARLYRQAQTYTQQLEQSQLQTVKAEKMASLGNLVAGVAHEINNPIGFLKGSIKNSQTYFQELSEHLALYQQHHPPTAAPVRENAEDIDLDFLLEDFPKLLDSMTAANQRIQSISTSLRTFSRADTEHKVSADLHEGLDSTLLILKYRLKGNEHRPAIEVVKDYGELPIVDCFPGQLNQVFMNLLANAIDIFDESAEHSSFAELNAQPQIITVKTVLCPDPKWIEVRIGDNGKGMPEDVKARIFDHLFTTKGVSKGTGLGLAIARQIVIEKHGGSLTVQSELGQGTEFCIQLPF